MVVKENKMVTEYHVRTEKDSQRFTSLKRAQAYAATLKADIVELFQYIYFEGYIYSTKQMPI